jgi:hypothetical protein
MYNESVGPEEDQSPDQVCHDRCHRVPSIRREFYRGWMGGLPAEKVRSPSPTPNQMIILMMIRIMLQEKIQEGYLTRPANPV